MGLLVRKIRPETQTLLQCGTDYVLLFDLLDTFCQQEVYIL